jgi:Prealbumin-like fold domain
VTLALADAKTCTITANDVAPKLTVTTVVVNGANGTAVPSDFDVHVRSGTTEAPGSPQRGDLNGTAYTLSTGAYGVSADGVPGYSVAGSGDCNANGAVSLALGDVKACKLTATAGAPTLHVVTQVVNDNGGTLTPGAFTIHVRGAGADVPGSPQVGSSTGRPYSLGIGDYVVGADPAAGYTFAVSGQCASSGAVTLATGDDKSCTITANDVAPKLTVITTVVNDNGGTRAPSGFAVHVRKAGADAAGSPKAGSSSGTGYTLSAGTYAVGADPVTGYTAAVGGGCASNGSVTLAVGQSKTCTVAANDKPPLKSALPPPVAHKSANLTDPTGPVTIKLPDTKKFVPLTGDLQVPLGTIVNVKKGRITLTAASNNAGGTATAFFYGGIFKLGQTKAKKPITVLSLVEKLTGCKAKGNATIAKRKKARKRRLWGDGKGHFRTKGRNSAATVLGTKWMVEDRCTSTLTRVARGKVRVQDFGAHKTVIVRKGHKYIARARTP